MKLFDMFKKERYIGDRVDLIKSYELEGEEDSISIYYNIVLHDTNKVVGRCDLRVGMNWELYYAGNIGYSIDLEYRGNKYAYSACQILFEIAKNDYNMDELIITCSPDNIASYKTCLYLDGKLLETVVVPENHWLAMRGETVKHIFKYKI
ncbi:MAG: GNAT family N-acetyltransferase [Erysipelotrichaceae bacterium]|nr:GNAT family N-acetyltransferase [Erysipelotrichaceae bacterium]